MNENLIQDILYIITALVGYFTRWLQGRKKVKSLENKLTEKDEMNMRLHERNQFLKDNLNTK